MDRNQRIYEAQQFGHYLVINDSILPLQLLLLTFATWINRRHALVIDYLHEENRILREQLGNKKLRLTNDQRRRLAVKGRVLGRKILSQVATIVTPGTILGSPAPINISQLTDHVLTGCLN